MQFKQLLHHAKRDVQLETMLNFNGKGHNCKTVFVTSKEYNFWNFQQYY